MDLKTEVIRNTTGYFLVIVGVACIAFGSHSKMDKLTETGVTLVTSSLLAFQAKRTPDGQTSTLQVTTPEQPATPKV